MTEMNNTPDAKTIGFIGAGNMGEAIIGALIQSGLFARDQIAACDISPDRLEYMKKTYHINTMNGPAAVFNSSDMVVIAVKPQQMADLLENIRPRGPLADRKLVISIAAGIPIRKMEAHLYADLDAAAQAALPIIRVMPNTPALVLSGMSVMSPNAYATPQDLAGTREILASMGQVMELDEKYLDGVTALSGSGPAYVFFLAECMIAAGRKLGFSNEESRILSIATIKGAAKLMEQSPDTPEELRRKVTSPNGTTEAAFKVIDGGAVKDHMVDAIIAAAHRAEVLSR